MKAAWTACGLLLLAQALCAGTIRLETAVLTHVDPDEAALLVVVRNSGDERAHQLAVEGRLGGQVAAGPALDLEPGGSEDVELIFSADTLPPGTHVAELLLRYRDRNGYPFSTVAAASVTIGGHGAPSPVRVSLAPVTISNSGRLQVRLQLDAASAPRTVRVRALLPDDLGCEAPDRAVTVFPGRLTAVEAALSNRTGRAGSVYPVFAVIREETPGGVCEQAVRGTVTLAGSGLGRFPWAAFGFSGAVMLALVFLILQTAGKAEGPDGA